jgi:signal transduction histidine kinase
LTGKALGEERLRLLLEVGRTLVSELDLESILQRLLEVARDITGASYAAIGILDEEKEGLKRFLTLGIDEQTRNRIGPLPQGRGILGLLIQEPKPLRLHDVSSHSSSYGFPPGHPPMRSFLGVPIIIRGSAYGNLYLTEKQGGDFDEADEEAAVVLAAWAGIAIDNASTVAEETLRRSIMASEQERARWARELHDETLQSLGALRVLLAGGLKGEDPDSLKEIAEDAVSRLGSEIANLRSLITELRPGALDEIGVAAAIEGLAARTEAVEGVAVECDLHIGGTDGTQPLDPELESTIYRLVQEALTNVGKHARAERVDLHVRERDGTINIVVRDDGVGFDPAAKHHGFGLLGMTERAAMAGGELNVSSSPGAGTRVRAVLPIRGPSSEHPEAQPAPQAGSKAPEAL